MVKKHKGYKPQRRGRLKKTTGKLEFVDVVYMEKETVDGTQRVYATCTCGKWRSSPEASTIQKVAIEAKAHVDSGPCRLRQHPDGPGNSAFGDGDPTAERAAALAADPLSEEALS